MKGMTVRTAWKGAWLGAALCFTGAAIATAEEMDAEEAGDAADDSFLNEDDGTADEASADEEAVEDEDADRLEDDAEPGEDDPGKWNGRKRDHARQGFVNILLGTGYFLVAPWDKDDPEKRCETDSEDPTRGEPVCSGRSGIHLDMLAGYGLKPGFELFAMFRLGLEQPTKGGLEHQPKVRQAGIGFKFYSPKEGFFKIGFGVAPLFDFSNRGGVDVRPDFVIHVPIAAQFDIFPWFGPYLQIAPNISFISEFRIEFTGGGGVQGRFP